MPPKVRPKHPTIGGTILKLGEHTQSIFIKLNHLIQRLLLDERSLSE